MGKGTLRSMVETMCVKAGITGNKSNSLKATASTCMYEGNVPERIIQEQTGHPTVETLRTYQRTSLQQQKAVLWVLAAPCKSDFIDLTSGAVVADPVGSSQASVGLSLPNTSASVHSAHGSCLPPTGSSEASVGPSPTGSSASFHSLHGCTFNFNFGK